MTIKYCFVLRDKASDSFQVPFFSPSPGVTYRMLSDELKRVDESNMLRSHPEDFSLWDLGAFDDETGAFLPVDGGKPVLLVELSKLKE